MKLHLYCVRRAGDPPPRADLLGVRSAPVHLLEAAELGVWLSETGASAGPDLEQLRLHDDVVREALRSATPIPIRFGQLLASEAAARDLLSYRQEEFAATLDRIAERVEVGVRVGWVVPSPEGQSDRPDNTGSGVPSRGRAYLEERRRALAERESLLQLAEARLDEAEREFSALNLPTVRTTLAAEAFAGSLAHLVHRRELRHFRQFALNAQRRRPDLRLAFSGPWAPYSFVSHGTY